MTAPTLNERIPMERVVGNREAIGATILDNNGTAINLTGKTVKFRMVNCKTEAVKVNDQTATLDTAASGKVSYTPVADDVDTAGLYACYFIIDGAIPRRFPYDGAKWLMRIKSETDRS